MSKSLFSPPRRQATSPVFRSTLYTAQVLRAEMIRYPSGLRIYGVDVEVVESRLEVGRRFVVGLIQPDVLQAVPLEEHLSGLDVDLLDYTVENFSVYGTADAREGPGHFAVDRDQCRILGRDEELVVVPLEAVACPYPLYLPVGVVARSRTLPGRSPCVVPPTR